MAARSDAVSARPAWHEGRYSRWLTASDHKAVGALYVGVALVFLALATLGMLIVRAHTNGDGGNDIFPFHLGAALFLVPVPLALGLATYLVPLQLGERGVPAPQFGAFAFWLYALGGLTLVLTFFSGGAGACGWTCLGPLTDTGHTGDLWLLGLGLLAAGTALACLHLLATLRASALPAAFRPPFTRAVAAFALLAIPVAVLDAVVSVLLVLARHGHLGWSVVALRHLSWAYGWPFLALLLLPAYGALVEIFRIGRPLSAVAGATAALLTVLGGLGGTLVLTGFEGAPFTWHYAFAIAAYVAGAFALIALVAALHYWWPKLFGRKLGEETGTAAVWLIAIGLNFALFPAYLARPGGEYAYPHFARWDTLARVSMVGYGVFAVGVVCFLANVVRSHALRFGARAGNDPWRADTLEWLTTSPPPPHNFDRVPVATSARPLHDLRAELEEQRVL